MAQIPMPGISAAARPFSSPVTNEAIKHRLRARDQRNAAATQSPLARVAGGPTAEPEDPVEMLRGAAPAVVDQLPVPILATLAGRGSPEAIQSLVRSGYLGGAGQSGTPGAAIPQPTSTPQAPGATPAALPAAPTPRPRPPAAGRGMMDLLNPFSDESAERYQKGDFSLSPDAAQMLAAFGTGMMQSGSRGDDIGTAIGAGLTGAVEAKINSKALDYRRRREARKDAMEERRLRNDERRVQLAEEAAKKSQRPVVGEFYDEQSGRPFKSVYYPATGRWERMGGTKTPEQPKPPTTTTIYDKSTGREVRVQYNSASNEWEPIGGPKADQPTKAPAVTTYYDEASGREIRAQFNLKTKTWEPIGGTKAPSNKGRVPTLAQEAYNRRIDAARQRIRDKFPEMQGGDVPRNILISQMQETSATGRDNPLHDPTLKADWELATRTKVGGDPDFDAFMAELDQPLSAGPPSPQTKPQLSQQPTAGMGPMAMPIPDVQQGLQPAAAPLSPAQQLTSMPANSPGGLNNPMPLPAAAATDPSVLVHGVAYMTNRGLGVWDANTGDFVGVGP